MLVVFIFTQTHASEVSGNLNQTKKRSELAVSNENHANKEHKQEELINDLQQKIKQNENDFESLTSLGMIYHFGVKKDLDKAISYYEKASLKGGIMAKYHLSLIYLNERSNDLNNKKAYQLLSKLAEDNETEIGLRSQVDLAICYLNGVGIEPNFDKAIVWFQKAANTGYSYAQMCLGDIYIEKDRKQALHWYQKVAEKPNDEDALFAKTAVEVLKKSDASVSADELRRRIEKELEGK